MVLRLPLRKCHHQHAQGEYHPHGHNERFTSRPHVPNMSPELRIENEELTANQPSQAQTTRRQSARNRQNKNQPSFLRPRKPLIASVIFVHRTPLRFDSHKYDRTDSKAKVKNLDHEYDSHFPRAQLAKRSAPKGLSISAQGKGAQRLPPWVPASYGSSPSPPLEGRAGEGRPTQSKIINF